MPMVMNHSQNRWFAGIAITLCLLAKFHLSAEIGVGAKPASGSDVLFDGSRASLDENGLTGKALDLLPLFPSSGKLARIQWTLATP